MWSVTGGSIHVDNSGRGDATDRTHPCRNRPTHLTICVTVVPAFRRKAPLSALVSALTCDPAPRTRSAPPGSSVGRAEPGIELPGGWHNDGCFVGSGRKDSNRIPMASQFSRMSSVDTLPSRNQTTFGVGPFRNASCLKSEFFGHDHQPLLRYILSDLNIGRRVETSAVTCSPPGNLTAS